MLTEIGKGAIPEIWSNRTRMTHGTECGVWSLWGVLTRHLRLTPPPPAWTRPEAYSRTSPLGSPVRLLSHHQPERLPVHLHSYVHWRHYPSSYTSCLKRSLCLSYHRF